MTSEPHPSGVIKKGGSPNMSLDIWVRPELVVDLEEVHGRFVSERAAFERSVLNSESHRVFW